MIRPADSGEADVVVAGTGAAGLTAAIAAASRGSRVAVFEKLAQPGGTTRKSAAWFWIPNNRLMREAGMADDRSDALRYMARLSRPERFDPAHPTLGLPQWEYDGLAAFYDEGPSATEELEKLGAFEIGGDLGFPDYYAHLDLDTAPQGRTLWPARAGGAQIGGQVLIDGLLETARRLGIRVQLSAPVVNLGCDDTGAVHSVTVRPVGAGPVEVPARAAIFGSGGFTHDPDLRLQFLNGPYIGGCASAGNTGDFLRIAQRLGADLANMSRAWSAPIVIERMLQEPQKAAGSFSLAGDAMIFVNCDGERFVNEKAPYNEIALAQLAWDPGRAKYPHLPLIAVWDDDAARRFGGPDFGNPIPAPGVDPYWVVTASDLPELTAAVSKRLRSIQQITGGARLADDFLSRFTATIARFNRYAAAGRDEQFHRGETPIERAGTQLMGASDWPNPTMRPLAERGPYHATLLGPGTLDTKGGPRADVKGRVLRPDGSVIPGLFGAGNAVASPSGQGYFGGGGTLGPILTGGFRAGLSAAQYCAGTMT